MGKLRDKTAEIRSFILTNIEKQPSDITAVTAQKFNISKQAVRKHIQSLIEGGLVSSSGVTRDRKYQLKPIFQLSLEYPVSPTLEEDKIWRQQLRPKLEGVNQNVINICQYGFTEMINNVIDHSESNLLNIQFISTAASVEIAIGDNGVGIFNKIQTVLGLEDPLHVILELSKGKLTTDPKHHTGEGIFFTSRMFDNFTILSGHLFFTHTEPDDDWLIEEQAELFSGTFVKLSINLTSKRTIQEVFDRYAGGDDYGFSRTHIPVTLARYGDENLISRSQAKRLLARFERFKEIVLDFKDVEMIGQAFADEIFRVYGDGHPQVHLTYVGANEQVDKMIKHAISK
jgi:anti-sigma regulatory factor (Ser/Thr protein kinase)